LDLVDLIGSPYSRLVLELAFAPDRDAPEPMYRQLGAYLRGLILNDRLAPGGKLPATRELAAALGLSRNTVALAYEELVADGWLTAHVGQGTFVTGRPGLRGAVRAVAAPTRGFVWSGLFARRTHALAAPPGFAPAPGAAPIRFDFRGGRVALDALPTAAIRRGLADAVGRLGDLANHVNPQGWMPLREGVARYLVSRGIECTAAGVAIVNGAQQAIDLAARVLLDPGDTVVMEQPGYFGAALAFAACQANIVGIGVDAEGLRTDELARVLRARRVKLVYTTPASQSPTGVVMSAARREALLRLADEHQAPILEDDYDSELRYEGVPVAALKTADPAAQVIYVGTFSKVLCPGLRVGYVVAAPPLLAKMALARWNTDANTNVIAQAALAHLLRTGGLERHLRRVRRTYAARLAAMLEALAEHMPPGTTWSRPRGGLMVWVGLPRGCDAEGVHRDAAAAGIALAPGTVFYATRDGRGASELALSFADLQPAAIDTGIATLGAIVRRHGAAHSRRA
jgi:GntR family transcriptional regulator/MocR family aminotransferase